MLFSQQLLCCLTPIPGLVSMAGGMNSAGRRGAYLLGKLEPAQFTFLKNIHFIFPFGVTSVRVVSGKLPGV